MPDARLLASATALLGAGAVGLGIPAPAPRLDVTGEPQAFDAPDDSWPEAALKWLEAAYRGLVPRTTTASFGASGRIRLGRSPWLPVSYQTWHELGTAFKADLSATWYGKTYVRATDGYADGHGITNVRNQSAMGPGLDQGAVPFLWSEAILVPSTWGMPGVELEQNAEDRLEVRIAEDAPVAGPLQATIEMDPSTGLPRRFSVPWRAKDHEGETGAGWSVDYLDWHPTDHGASVGMMQVNWADDSRPWLRLRLEPVSLGVPVAVQIDEVRALIARHVADTAD